MKIKKEKTFGILLKKERVYVTRTQLQEEIRKYLETAGRPAASKKELEKLTEIMAYLLDDSVKEGTLSL